MTIKNFAYTSEVDDNTNCVIIGSISDPCTENFVTQCNLKFCNNKQN